MNLGTALVSLLLIVIVVAIIRSIVKDKRAGKNVGCGSCKSCAHATTSSSFKKTSHAASGSCPSCAHIDAMLAGLDQSVDSSVAIPPKSSHELYYQDDGIASHAQP